MTESLKYVAYIIGNHKNHTSKSTSTEEINAELHTIENFIKSKNGELMKTFVELGDNKKSRHPWPELEEAIQFALENKAHFVISKINTLTSNPAFCSLISGFIDAPPALENGSMQLYCCDQPYIQKNNFKEITKHAQEHSKNHGSLIRAGLQRSHAKSGNPHAVELINKVNKPKIDNAIVYALMLAPVIQHYQLKGHSQRKIVAALNEDGFKAPEGGTWVLSQLQKVMARMKINEAALDLEDKILQMKSKGQDNESIAETFNKLSIPSPLGQSWDKEVVQLLEERLKLIDEILSFHEFVLSMTSLIEKYHLDELTEELLFRDLQQAGIQIPDALYPSTTKH